MSRRRTRRPESRSTLLGAALVFVLLAVEAFAVVHPLDFAAHATDEPCKICISVASLGSANAEPSTALQIVSGAPSVPFFASAYDDLDTASNYLARAPPHAS